MFGYGCNDYAVLASTSSATVRLTVIEPAEMWSLNTSASSVTTCRNAVIEHFGKLRVLLVESFLRVPGFLT